MEHTFCYDDSTIAITTAGAVRGYRFDGVYRFLGIPYARARRFHAPEPVEPWEGVRDATSYGTVCPVNGAPVPNGEVYTPHQFWPQDENCQNLNVWTASLDARARKPVLVWFHGGGFADGSAVEQLAYEGASIASYGDVVVVTVNHRLNILGFLDLSSFDEAYANSANAGIADLVAALHWVHDNIAAFGGDPEAVTIAGQSGGGGKVQTLCQVPAAHGLFHRGIIMSGIHDDPRDSDLDHAPLVREMLKILGLAESQVHDLETISYARLIDAFNRVNYQLAAECGRAVVWGPKKNGWYMGDPSVNPMTEFSKEIPMMLGTVFGEFTDRTHAARLAAMDDAGRRRELEDAFGDDTDAVVRCFAAAYPDRPAYRALCVDTACRPATIRAAERIARQGRAPVFVYLFAPEFHMCGPTEAWHCSDIPFLFHNTDLIPFTNCAGAGKRLEAIYGDALLRFVRTGDPHDAAGRVWNPFTRKERVTMVFGAEPTLREAYDDELLELMMKHLGPLDTQSMMVDMVLAAHERSWNY